ncbi:MAG: B12-binding domain-containing radical SAM protein [Thermodesulfobacteriota bacterium]
MKQVKNILMVYPAVSRDTYWSFYHALSFIGKKSSMPPLGLCTVAAWLPESCDVRLVDENVERLTDGHLAWADTVFVSAMIVQKDSFATVVARANAAGKPVVAGGPYPTSSRAGITGVSCFVMGEAEPVMPEFVSDLMAGTLKPEYKACEKPDISETPIPRFDLLKRSAYACMAVQYSRGCPFSCEFCDIWKTYGNRVRVKNPETVLAELSSLYDLGWQGPVFLVDDNFIGNKGRVKKQLLPALYDWQKGHGFSFRFLTEASINLAQDPELLSAMRDVGFNEVFIGIETPSREALAETGKSQNLACDLAESVRVIQSYGLEVMAGFILGFDSDTDDIAERQIEFIQRAGIPRAMVGLLTALPGTELYQRLEKEGRIVYESDGNNVGEKAMNFVPRMDLAKVFSGYSKVLSQIYDRNLKNYFSRCNKVLDNIAGNPMAARSIGLTEIKAVLKSISRQPFTPYGWQYIKFLFRNLVRNTSVFSEAVMFSIVGHHLHRITHKTIVPAIAA